MSPFGSSGLRKADTKEPGNWYYLKFSSNSGAGEIRLIGEEKDDKIILSYLLTRHVKNGEDFVKKIKKKKQN